MENIFEPVLGSDWLQSCRGLWNFKSDSVTIYGQEYPLLVGACKSACRQVVVAETVLVPAWTELVIPAPAEVGLSRMEGHQGEWCLERVNSSILGVIVTSELYGDQVGDAIVYVLNASAHPVMVDAEVVLAKLTPMEGQVKSVNEASKGDQYAQFAG